MFSHVVNHFAKEEHPAARLEQVSRAGASLGAQETWTKGISGSGTGVGWGRRKCIDRVT